MEVTPVRITIDQDTELRVLEEKDAIAIFAIIERNRDYLRQWLPWVDFTRSVADEHTFILSLQAQYLSNNGFVCAIWYQGQIVGTIGYHPIDWAHRTVEIGYWLAADFQGKGLMTKSCSALITYAFERLQLNKVVIRCAIGNMRSCAIPQRLGFKYEGVIKQGEWLYDHFVDLSLYSLLAHEWTMQRDTHL